MALADDQTVIVAAIDLQIEKKKQKPVKDVTGWRQAVDKPGDKLETGRTKPGQAGTGRDWLELPGKRPRQGQDPNSYNFL